ncbi:MAG: hydrogenase expression/formation protein HypE [Deltaproteobacteria bacterium]|uniref:Hydrogenase expression/formation protein HypE n=1 Tax=Candidatus Zymogenus saltonus TaxID=2844893 RepID=A0A9D8KGD4_9DELT|nr:hydrogenase expression/formation protein HypE [Candidatus Zymogenus saltonus]
MEKKRIVLAHGGGGVLTRELVEEIIVPSIGGSVSALPDAARVPGAEDLYFTTDSFVVKPLFFNGGNIGSLSIHGTVNDLAVSGAEPVAVSFSLIIEEGLEMDTLRRIVESAGRAAAECSVSIITGDTKVVARGDADQLFVNTAGIGIRRHDMGNLGIKEGDAVLINGPIAEHGIAVMSRRKGIDFDIEIESDSAPVWPYVKALLDGGVDIHAMRDPTRGGVAATLVELSGDHGVTTELYEDNIPVRAEVRAACEMLGLDPLSVANEGKLLVFVSASDAEKALEILRATSGGENAEIIGRAVKRRAVSVFLKTCFGGERVVEMPYGEELPRIC